jgi:hypothetical protein
MPYTAGSPVKPKVKHGFIDLRQQSFNEKIALNGE